MNDAGRGESRLLIAALLTSAMLVGEAIGGIMSGSLALLADAGHMLVDASALVLAWLGARFARRPPDALRSFGYARLEVLAGFVNALSLFAVAAWIVWEAIERMLDPAPILSGVMLAVAIAGLLVNLVVLWILGRDHGPGGHMHGHDHGDTRSWHARASAATGRSADCPAGSADERRGGANEDAAARDENLNVRGARLHVIGDLLGSVAAIVAALVIHFTGWTIADPVLSILVALLILASAGRLLRRSAHILLEGVPEGVDIGALTSELTDADPGIRDVHHVHVWMLGSGARMATLHLRIDASADAAGAQQRVRALLEQRYAIDHVTIQVDPVACPGPACGSSA